jgi:hypothetical protein
MWLLVGGFVGGFLAEASHFGMWSVFVFSVGGAFVTFQLSPEKDDTFEQGVMVLATSTMYALPAGGSEFLLANGLGL